MEKVEVVPSAPPRGPAGLDGVLIDSCEFTETVGKKEPRPPLFLSITTQSRITGSVFLAVENRKVLVLDDGSLDLILSGTSHDPVAVGRVYDGRPLGPSYTGPITPAMWAIIRKWWTP